MNTHQERYQNRNWVTMEGDIYRRNTKTLQKNISDLLGLTPGDIGLVRLNKDQLIELYLAIKKIIKNNAG